MWPSVFFSDIRIEKCGQACQKKSKKNSQANGSLRENISIFFITPLLSRRNVGTTSKERNQLAYIPEYSRIVWGVS